MDSFRYSFGDLLKTFRKQKKWTQQTLADLLGAHRNTISIWERGDFLPESKTIVLEIARVLGLDEKETRYLLEASLTAITPYWLVPYPRNLFFTGREEILQAMHTFLCVDQAPAFTQTYAVHGLGGVGKTQIALEYAYRHSLEYSAVFWIEAETIEHISFSMLRIAEVLQLPEREETDQQRVVAAVQRWLAAHGQWLLIWDNLEDLELLQRFLPPVRQGATLITTRSQALGTLAQGIDLAPMDEREGALFLLRRAKMLGPEATGEQLGYLAMTMPAAYIAALELAAAVGGLPLALDQAGAYIEETGCDPAGYLQRYRRRDVHLLNRRGTPGRDHPQSVTTTFRLSIEQVEQEQSTAADILRVCALLHAEAIPEELFMEGAVHLGPELAPLADDPLRFDQTIAILHSLSLLQRQPGTRTLSLHRLVQVVMREQMSEQEQTMWLKRAFAALNAVFPTVVHETWDRCERLLLHVLTCAALLPDQAGDQTVAEVLQKAAGYLRARAQYEQAEPLYQQALRIWEQMALPLYPQLAESLNSLANLYYDQGKYAQAEPLYQRALCIREQTLGLANPEVAISLNNLARLYWSQGKHKQAEPLYLRALHIGEQALGPEHPGVVAASLNNLAILFTEQGKYEQAESLFERALHIWEKAWGPEHPRVAASLNNLALLSYNQGKYAQAEALYRRALNTQEKALGSEHPELSHPLNGLADIYTKQGKYELAEPLYQRALHIWESVLGPAHPFVAQPLNGLANLYAQQEMNEQAEALFQRALRIREEHLGMHHPETAQTLYDLSAFHQKQGSLSEALSLAEQALKICFQALGDGHPQTLATRELYTRLMQASEGKTCQD